MKRICLASSSPRRLQLLEQAGYDVLVVSPSVDDGLLVRPNVSPRQWVMSLAYLKARSVAQQLDDEIKRSIQVVLGADTVCVVDGMLLGQPKDAHDAAQMIRAMRNKTHQTMTGICLLDPHNDRRMFAVDVAAVEVGNISDEQIERYINSGDWQGKAGAYNLVERVEAGWPIQCQGDPATVMGLPMNTLPKWLCSFEQSDAGAISPAAISQTPIK